MPARVPAFRKSPKLTTDYRPPSSALSFETCLRSRSGFNPTQGWRFPFDKLRTGKTALLLRKQFLDYGIRSKHRPPQKKEEAGRSGLFLFNQKSEFYSAATVAVVFVTNDDVITFMSLPPTVTVNFFVRTSEYFPSATNSTEASFPAMFARSSSCS